MTVPTLDAEPACPGPADGLSPIPSGRAPLRAERRRLDDIPRSAWDALLARTPWATPFSSWAFHRAWWDGYGATAHEETLIICPSGQPTDVDPVAIVPLMHRHEVEPSDALTHTTIRHGGHLELTPVSPRAKAIFFGASYHADYATVLSAPEDLRSVAEAVGAYLAGPDCGDWDVVDLRRLRCADPAGAALAAAFGPLASAHEWTLTQEREDVCPVMTVPEGVDLEGFLSTLGKKERHEIRRKVRRAEAVGTIRLEDAADPLEQLDEFIDLHQKRWGEDGLFPPTPGGARSRVFARRLFELAGADGPVRLTFLSVGGRRIAAGIHFETADGILYYNAGIDPDARDLSPGVLMIHAYVARAIERGLHRLDFLRGDEPYKYEWGAVDEPIQRLLVRRGSST